MAESPVAAPDARRRAVEALAKWDAHLPFKLGRPLPVFDTVECVESLRALLASDPPAGEACPDCGGQGWYPKADRNGDPEQVQCQRCDMSGRAPSPAPSPPPLPDAVREAAEKLRVAVERYDTGHAGGIPLAVAANAVLAALAAGGGRS